MVVNQMPAAGKGPYACCNPKHQQSGQEYNQERLLAFRHFYKLLIHSSDHFYLSTLLR